jgi:hypothetical protein
MPSMSLSMPHSLGQDEALRRLKAAIEKAKSRNEGKVNNLKEDWNGNRLDYSFSTFGFNIKGDVAVEPNEVKLNGSLPFAAMMFKGKIEQTVRDELGKILA